MKKFMLLILLLSLGCMVNAQDLVAEFQNKYKDNTKFTLVNISAKMFGLIADISDPDTESVLKNLTGFKLLKSSTDVVKYHNEALGMIKGSKRGYEELMDVREGKEHVSIYVRDEKGIVTELVILVETQQEFVLMGFIGNIDLKKIAALSKSVDVNGMEYLNKINKSNK